jgi:anthranilate synthase/aminodeoxychorismate synthase-like glutamine amidotransferase
VSAPLRDPARPTLLLIDNYDSFTYNIAHLFGALGAEVTVLRNDDDALDEAALLAHELVCIGPGPGRPASAGKTMEAIGWIERVEKPLLGICLGLQALGEYYGGEVIHAPGLMHGKTSRIEHDGKGVFANVPSPFEATRYHSLCVAHDPFPAALRATATSDDGVIQGVVHRALPIYGVQFHPESVLTPMGYRIAANFLELGSASIDPERAASASLLAGERAAHEVART